MFLWGAASRLLRSRGSGNSALLGNRSIHRYGGGPRALSSVKEQRPRVLTSGWGPPLTLEVMVRSQAWSPGGGGWAAPDPG